MKLLSRVWLFATPWTVAHQAPPSMKFSRQEYWSGLPFPSPGDLPDPGIEPRSPTSQQMLYRLSQRLDLRVQEKSLKSLPVGGHERTLPLWCRQRQKPLGVWVPDGRGFTLYLRQVVTPEQTRGGVQVLKVTLIDVREGSEQLGLFPLM